MVSIPIKIDLFLESSSADRQAEKNHQAEISYLSLESTEFQCFINRKSKFILQVIDCYIQFFNSDSTKKAVNPNSHGPTLSISKIKCDVNQKTISQRTQKLHFRKNVFFLYISLVRNLIYNIEEARVLSIWIFFPFFSAGDQKYSSKAWNCFFLFPFFFCQKET